MGLGGGAPSLPGPLQPAGVAQLNGGRRSRESRRLGSHSSSANHPAVLSLPLTHQLNQELSATTNRQECPASLRLPSSSLGSPVLPEFRHPREKFPRRDSPGRLRARLDHVKQALTEENQSEAQWPAGGPPSQRPNESQVESKITSLTRAGRSHLHRNRKGGRPCLLPSSCSSTLYVAPTAHQGRWRTPKVLCARAGQRPGGDGLWAPEEKRGQGWGPG